MKISCLVLSSSLLLLLVNFPCFKCDFDDDDDVTSFQEDRTSDHNDDEPDNEDKDRSKYESEDSHEASTSKPNIFVYLPYRHRTTTVRPATSTPSFSSTKWIPKGSVNSLRNWTPSPAKDLINRSSNIQSEKFPHQTLQTSSKSNFPLINVADKTASDRTKLETSPSAVSYVQQSPVQYGSPPQQNVVVVQDQSRVPQVVQAPPTFIQAPPTYLHSQSAFVQQSPPVVVHSPPAQQVVQYNTPTQFVQAPPQPEPVQFFQSPPVHVVQQSPPLHVVQQSPPLHVVQQSPPLHVVQRSPPLHVVQQAQPIQLQQPPLLLQAPRSPIPCPPQYSPPLLLQAPPPRPIQFAPPPPPPGLFFSPPRPVRTRTVYTQVEQVPIQTHVQTTTHFSPATRTIVYDSLGSNPRPAFAQRPRMYASSNNMMPLIMPPDSMESMEWMPPPSKPPSFSKPPPTKTMTTKSPPSFDGQGLLGAGGIVSTLGGRVLGTLAEKYFEHEEKRKKKKIKYKGHKILLKALIKRKP